MNPRILPSVLITLIVVGFVSAQDTLKVNPDSVSLKFENDHVRVIESVLKPGAKDKEHSHPNYVTYVIGGGSFKVHSNGAVAVARFKTGDTVFREAQTHWAANIGKTTTRLLLFELKDEKPAGAPFQVPPDQDPVKISPQYYRVVIDNKLVRVLEYRLKPGQKEPMHTHPCGVVYYLTGTKWKATASDGKTTETYTKPGQIFWRGVTTHAAENAGKTEARALAIELKGPCEPGLNP
jgi:quercetin dioxygenase-like cupin family protein